MKTTMKTALVACTVLALIPAVMYVLIGTDVVSIPRLGAEQAPIVIFDIAAACYLVGGLLVLARRRWLWTIGLVANTLVISIFFLAYYDEPEMMFSTAGLATKSAQMLLEAGLIYLVAAGRRTQSAHEIQPNSRQSDPVALTSLAPESPSAR